LLNLAEKPALKPINILLFISLFFVHLSLYGTLNVYLGLRFTHSHTSHFSITVILFSRDSME